MHRIGLLFVKLGLIGIVGGSFGLSTAQAQYVGYSSYGPNQVGWSVQGGGYSLAPLNQGYPNYPSGAISSGVSGYYPGYRVNPGVAYQAYPSPAQRQGYREGQLYWETGVAPNRPLSPAEARGFAAGERRAASTPWQYDPARQEGYREGQLYWETGIAPNRPLSPAEAQGFRAGENRAASGYGSPY